MAQEKGNDLIIFDFLWLFLGRQALRPFAGIDNKVGSSCIDPFRWQDEIAYSAIPFTKDC